MGLPELKPSSSEVTKTPQSFGTKVVYSPSSKGANGDLRSPDVLMGLRDPSRSSFGGDSHSRAAKRSERRTTLPPIFENMRGMVREPGSPEEWLRPTKRSRSSTALCSAPLLPESSKVASRSASKLGSLPALGHSQSTGALPSCPKNRASGSNNDVEQVLESALAVDACAGVSKAPQEPCRNSDEIEAHLEALLAGFQCDSRSASPEKKDRRARVSDSHGDNENRIRRKGTGFVHLDPAEQSTGRRAKIDDEHGDNENRICRKGTGYLHLSSSMSEANIARHARIHDDNPEKESKLRRKGTGFVHVRASPEKKSKRCVRIHDHHGDNENNIHRNGTGFVHLSALPKESPAVWFPDMTGGNVNHIQRKGTGFVFLNHVSPRVRIADDHGDNENNIHRKGTGFIDLSEGECDLPPCSPRLCSAGETDSPTACRNTSGTFEVSPGCRSADSCDNMCWSPVEIM